MIELARHIEILLLSNDCVIVPNLGGFVAHHVVASYDSDDRMFLPPLRTLGFNPQLKLNDSLLVQSYIEAYDISYPEALRRIEDEVEELKQQLSDNGSYELTDIGVLSVNEEGHYLFAPCEAGILSPTLYGLGSFEFRLLKEPSANEKMQPRSEAKPIALQASQESDEAHQLAETAEKDEAKAAEISLFTDGDEDGDDNAFQIKKAWVRNVVAIAAAVIAFFVFTTPVANSELGSQRASNQQNKLISKLMPKDTNATPIAAITEQKSNVKPATEAQPVASQEANRQAAVAEKQEAATATSTYCIVLASQVSRKNALLFIDELHRQGYQEAELYVYNNVNRVVMGNYTSESTAYKRLQKLRENEQFEEAWVYRKKAGN